MKRETFFKVCALQQTLEDVENNRILDGYFSINNNPGFTLKYELGKTTKAPRGTALFAFENLSQAEEYADSLQSIVRLAILKGTGIRYKHMVLDKIPAPWASYYFKKFWKRVRDREKYITEDIALSELRNTPNTFVFLSSFKPLEVIPRYF